MSNGINSALPVIAIMGPTASGKTGLALDIAAKVESEVISVDSALVYKGMDIGTAKPTQEELQILQEGTALGRHPPPLASKGPLGTPAPP